MVKDLTKTKVHPVAEFFPMMSPEEYEGLKKDIKANGQQEPVCYWRNELIDGRNRLQACQELGIKVEWWELSHDADPIPFIFSKNLHRRHLSTGQRAMLAARLANLSHGSNQHKSLGKSGKEDTPIGVSIEAAAKHASVSPQSVTRAKQVLERGSKAVQNAASQGKLAVTTATELATSSATKAEQSKAVKGGKEAIKGVLKKPPSPAKPSEDWHPREMSAPIMAHCQTLTKIGNDIKKRAEQRGGEWIDMQSVAEQIKQLKHSLKLSMYYADCPHCKAKGCKRCRQSGFFPVLKKQQVDEDNGVKK